MTFLIGLPKRSVYETLTSSTKIKMMERKKEINDLIKMVTGLVCKKNVCVSIHYGRCIDLKV